MKTPEFIYFDLGNVLLNFSQLTACRQIAEVTGLSAERVHAVLYDGGLEWDYECGKISTEAFYEEFCRRADVRPDVSRLARAASDIFRLNYRIVPLVAGLVTAGNRVGILSNTCSIHWEFVCDNRYGIVPDLFEVFALSYQIGAMKPDPVIYKAAAEQAGVPADHIFFTDDKLENVEGARRAGFAAVPFRSPDDLAVQLRLRGVPCNL